MKNDKNTIPPEHLPEGAIPETITPDYSNDKLRASLNSLRTTPDYETLSAFLLSLRSDYLIVDVSGSKHGSTKPSGKKSGHHIRIVRSTQGQLILPIFTSMAELRSAVPTAQRETVKGVVMPAIEALKLIRTDKFVAAQFDAGSAKFVVLRKFIERVLDEGDALTPDSLNS